MKSAGSRASSEGEVEERQDVRRAAGGHGSSQSRGNDDVRSDSDKKPEKGEGGLSVREILDGRSLSWTLVKSETTAG